MKTNILKLMMLFVLSLATVSCSDDEVVEKTVEVTPINIHGQWKLQEVDGIELPAGVYVYIDFNRKGTYKLYQKQDSQLPRYITGKFYVENDPRVGYVLSGKYDYENGNWNNEYIVTDLMKSTSMTWTVKDEKAEGDAAPEVQKFVHVDEIPADVLEAGKYDQEDK